MLSDYQKSDLKYTNFLNNYHMKKLFLLFIMQLAILAVTAQNTADITGDGKVDISDVNAVINAILHGTNLNKADVNGDGSIDIIDVNEVINEMLRPQPVTYSVKGVSFKMVPISGGTFTMGATIEQNGDASYDEYPAHQVTLSSFSIGQTEVTQELWQAVMGSNPSVFTGNLQRPVEYVTWEDCQEFITKLNQMTGKIFRLPTEAEWEYAARGGKYSQSFKYAGNNTIGDVAWYYYNSYAFGINSPNYGTHTVATKVPNELGLYDMSGNVWEWCNDRYQETYPSDPQTNPTGPASGSVCVSRGGCWLNEAYYCRVSKRRYLGMSIAINSLGLRLAL